MPRVRPYESQVGSGGDVPGRAAGLQDFGGTGLANLGQGIESLGQSAGQAQRIIQAEERQRQTADARLKLATIGNEQTQKWIQFSNTANPNDQNLHHNFSTGGAATDEDGPRAGSLNHALQSGEAEIEDPVAKESWRQGAASLSQHFLDKSMSLQVHLAGVAATQNSRALVDQFQNRLRADPSAYPGIAKEADAYVNGLTRIDSGKRQIIATSIREQLAESTVEGVIMYSPEEALERLDNGSFAKMGLTGEAADRSYRRASRSIQARKDQDKLEVEKRDIAARAAQQLMYQRATLLDKDGKRAYTTRSVIDQAYNDPNLGDKLKETISTLELKRLHEEGGSKVIFNENKYTRQLLPSIYNGKYSSEADVIKAGADYLDPAHANAALGHFHTYTTNATHPIKQEFSFGEQLIKGTFRLPPGASIDAAGVQDAGNRALDRFNTWFSGIVTESSTKGPAAFHGIDIQAKAREFRDHEYSGLYDNVIRILDQKRTSLRYKSHNELATAREKGEVSQKEWNLYSRQLESFEQMETIAAQKPQKTPKAGGRIGAD